MKNLKTKTLALIILFAFVSSCTTNGDTPNNTDPGLFSANTTETTTSGATIVWTESIDTDDDPVTYAIILEGQEIASGGTNLTYAFTGLESDTIYEGYVEARDGKGGTSKADFFFTTKPEVQTVLLKYRTFIDGETFIIVAYFEVEADPDATSYNVVVNDYSLNTIPATIGRTYGWTPESVLPTGDNVGTGSSGLTEFSPGVYHANTHVSSNGISNAKATANITAWYAAITGTAILTITK